MTKWTTGSLHRSRFFDTFLPYSNYIQITKRRKSYKTRVPYFMIIFILVFFFSFPLAWHLMGIVSLPLFWICLLFPLFAWIFSYCYLYFDERKEKVSKHYWRSFSIYIFFLFHACRQYFWVKCFNVFEWNNILHLKLNKKKRANSISFFPYWLRFFFHRVPVIWIYNIIQKKYHLMLLLINILCFYTWVELNN